MKYLEKDKTFIVRLEKGDPIIEKLVELCDKENIKAGYFNGLGACEAAELAHFSLKTGRYSTRKLDGQFEIVSLHGNISSLDGKSYIHAHLALADDRFNTFSGHLREAGVSPLAEIFLVALSGDLLRRKDEETGLNLLDIESSRL